MNSNTSWKRNAMIFGGVLGAIVGVFAARMLIKEAEENDNENALTAGKGLQIGMLVLGLLRQITNL